MAAVLTTASSIQCAHTGTVSTASTAKLSVGGSPVLVFPSSIDAKGISGCTTAPSSDASGPINVPCTTVSNVSSGRATKLTMSGQPVALDTLACTSNGMLARQSDLPLAAPAANQTKLTS